MKAIDVQLKIILQISNFDFFSPSLVMCRSYYSPTVLGEVVSHTLPSQPWNHEGKQLIHSNHSVPI